MADFLTAFGPTMGHEKWRWSNRSTDAGAETYAGLTRRWNSSWPGWVLIDHAKQEPSQFPGNLEELRPQLEPMVRDRYFEAYWQPILGDEIPSQAIANELFDQVVNRDIKEAVIDLQRAVNYHSGADGNWRAGKWAPVDVDGAVGRSQTIPALCHAIRCGRELHVVATHKSLREADNVTLTERRVTDRANAKGWTNRIWGTWLQAVEAAAA